MTNNALMSHALIITKITYIAQRKQENGRLSMVEQAITGKNTG